MDQYNAYQKKLRRRARLQAAAAWVLLTIGAFFLLTGLWFFLSIVIVAFTR